MPRGRRPAGFGHVDRLSGPAESKRRLRVILETLSGERSIREACTELEVSEARFHELRREALQGALGGLKPGRRGRPPRSKPRPPDYVEELEQQVDELKVELQAARVRTEIAMVMPHVLQDAPRKKNHARAKTKRKRRRR